MKYFKNLKGVLVAVMVLTMSAAIFTGCSGNNTPNSSNASSINSSNRTAPTNQTQGSSAVDSGNGNTAIKATGTDTDGDGIPDSVEKTYGTNPSAADTDGDGVLDKTDKDPVFTPSLIKETSTTALPVKVKDARVEDNVNAADHLEITLTNTGNTDLKDFDLYYTVTDTVTKNAEGYYVKLTGFALEAGSTKTLHFDNKQGDLHYTGNFNGIYGTSKNEVQFQGQIHASAYAPLDFSTKKAKGTAEVAD
jgi:hypothetical protein